MKRDFSFPSSDGQTTIFATEWIPEGEVKMVLQICHGMVEYIGRYADFAEFLNTAGIYVVGNDHLGHGRSVIDDDHHGYFKHPDGMECVLADMHELRRITSEKYPDVPYYLLGHSMGSFLTRKYITMHGEGLAGTVIMGTGSQPGAVLGAGLTVCRILAAFFGWKHRSKLVYAMGFSSYNKRCKPARTRYDWLTKDTAIVDKYDRDPWCTYLFTLDGFYQMFRAIREVQKPAVVKSTNGGRILMVSGADDPVGAYGAGVRRAYDGLIAAGVPDVFLKLYDGDRHEILNETDRKAVYADILAWLIKENGQ